MGGIDKKSISSFGASRNQGITLGALIITIVVLIILATVTIQEISGDGIISRAKVASFRTEITQARENLELSKLEVQMLNNYSSNAIEEMISGGKLQPVPITDLTDFEEQLKFEIIYWGKYDLGISKVSKTYVKNNWESIFNDFITTENIPNLYYIKNGSEIKYLYDSNVNIIYKIKSTTIGINKVHSIEELDYVGIGDNIKERESLLAKITQESQIIETNGFKCYSPDLTGLVESNTKAIYYKVKEDGTIDETAEELEIAISEYLETKSITPKENNNYKFFDYQNNMWANIKISSNGVESYFVWIPRYAYKINSTATDLIDIKFIDLENNDVNENQPLDTNNYIVHPSFSKNGKELKGIWVGKYEPSAIENNQTNEEFYIPDLTGLDKENTYIEVYNNQTQEFTETKLANITNIRQFANNNNWYDYENQIWANIKIVNNGVEAWFVWIPRYAYSLTGTITSIKFVDLKGNALDGSTLDSSYVVHPAFTKNGKELKGIWVGKYEPSE